MPMPVSRMRTVASASPRAVARFFRWTPRLHDHMLEFILVVRTT